MNKGWPRFMDRRVKERLVGATILVVLIVLIVPELLSGPKGSSAAPPPPAGPAEPVRNVTVDLATSKATPAEPVTAASAVSQPQDGAAPAGTPPAGETASGNAAEPASASVADRGADPETIAAPEARAAPEGRAAPVARAAPPTISTLRAQQPAKSSQPLLESEPAAPKSNPSGQHWAVQLGSFASRANADNLLRRAKTHERSAYVSSGGKGKAVRFRVRIGPLADRNAAERMIAKLTKEGLPATLVPP